MPDAQLPNLVQHLVIGSGPGGSLTACLLAESGRSVVLMEEGSDFQLESCPAFTRAEMEQKYRSGGLTVAMGKTKVAYVEGRCVGGGSEINSGLYHRTPSDVIDDWRFRYWIDEFDEADLKPFFRANETDLSVGLMPAPAPLASQRLHVGAELLNWRSIEVPRWFSYSPTPENPLAGTKQSMTRTFVPRAVTAGCQLVANTRVLKLSRKGDGWNVRAERTLPDGTRQPWRFQAEKVFVACGAIQTPALLRRSGLGQHVGDTLHLHPTVKVTAQFPDEVNQPELGVPVHQVKEFSPRFSFGCSISSPPYLRLAMLDHPRFAEEVERNWKQMAIYYAMTSGGQGTVRTLPGFRDPLVRYHLDEADLLGLSAGLRKLCQCLFTAGADFLYPSVAGCPRLSSPSDVEQLPLVLPADRTNLMTIHLFSSCPMGEDQSRCVADSWGRVHGEKNLWIADASLLPGPPGVNPQGTIMAIARRNVAHYLASAD